MSLVILCFCYAVTLAALFNGQTTMWAGVPPAVAVILFFLLMCVVGMLEGMQIAFFAVAKLPKEEQAHHPMAMKTCDLLFKGEGRNLPGFMVGRQVCVTLCFFVIARVTTLDVEIGVDENIFGVSDGLQEFFNTGLLGAIITTVCASITWQLVASAFPVAFLSNPFVYILLRSVCSSSRLVSALEHGCLPRFTRRLLAFSTTKCTSERPKSVPPVPRKREQHMPTRSKTSCRDTSTRGCLRCHLVSESRCTPFKKSWR